MRCSLEHPRQRERKPRESTRGCMEKVLNQEEIDAMVRRARGGSAGTQAMQDVQPWNIKQAGQIGREQMKAINLLHEGFARNLTNSVGAYLRVAFDCSVVSVEQLTYR